MNEALQNPFIVLREHGLDPRLAALIDRLTYSPVGEDLASRALSLLDERPVPDEKVLHASLTPFIWFLDRAAEGGIQLTASGYLKPADVTAAAEVLPTMHGWIGQANREIDTPPVLHFRKALQALGLLRKHKGSLLLTRAGHDSRAAWQTLWNQLADRLVPNTDGFDTDATLLLLLYAATSPDSELPLDTIAAALTHLGWQSPDGTPIVDYDLYRLRALDVLATCRPRTSAEAAVGGSTAKSQSSRAQRCESRNGIRRARRRRRRRLRAERGFAPCHVPDRDRRRLYRPRRSQVPEREH